MNNPLNYVDPSGHQGCDEQVEDCDSTDLLDDGEEDSSDRILPDNPTDIAVLAGVPTVVGVNIDIGWFMDLVAGQELNGGVGIAFNWYSGEISYLPNWRHYQGFGTPDVVGIGSSIQTFTVTGATSNDMLQGPAGIVAGQAGADALGKLSVVGDISIAYEDIEKEKYSIADAAIDPKSGMPVITRSRGVEVGANVVPTGIDGRVKWSEGFNYTWSNLIVDLY
jgi:hypothetical protein